MKKRLGTWVLVWAMVLTIMPVGFGNHVVLAAPPEGPVPAGLFGAAASTEIVVGGESINAYVAWQNVYTNEMHRMFNVTGVVNPTQIERLTFDLYIPVSRNTIAGGWEVHRFSVWGTGTFNYAPHGGYNNANNMIIAGGTEVTIGSNTYIRLSREFLFTNENDMNFHLQTLSFTTTLPIYIANVRVHWSDESAPAGLFGAAASTTITVGVPINAYVAWQDVYTNEMHRMFNVINVDYPTQVEKLSFNLFIPVSRSTITGGWEVHRFSVWGTGTFNYAPHGGYNNANNMIIAGGTEVTIGGNPYIMLSREFLFNNQSDLNFHMQTLSFTTTLPIFITNVMVHYPITQTDYTVTWHVNGGSPAPTQTTVAHNGTITAPAAMTRQGYDFVGWFANANLTGTAVTFPIDNVTSERTFHVRWEPESVAPQPGWVDMDRLHLWQWGTGSYAFQQAETIAVDGVQMPAFRYAGGSWNVDQWAHAGGGNDLLAFMGPNDVRTPTEANFDDFLGATRVRYTMLIPQMLTVPTQDYLNNPISDSAVPRLTLTAMQNAAYIQSLNQNFVATGSNQDGWTWPGDTAIMVNGIPYRMIVFEAALPVPTGVGVGLQPPPIGGRIVASYVTNPNASAQPVFVLGAQVYIPDSLYIPALGPGLYRLVSDFPAPANPNALQTVPITVGTEIVDAYIIHDGFPTQGGGTWIQNPFRFVPDPADGPIEYVRGISFTAFMPANIRRNSAQQQNVPHIRFDYTVLPATPSFLQLDEINATGLFVSPWLIPQGVEPNVWTQASAFASGTYNAVPGNIPEGPRPLEDFSFNFDNIVFIGGVPYIEINWTIEFSDLVPIQKDELIFTFSIANTNFDVPIYLTNIAAIYHDGPFGGSTMDMDWPEVIFMNGMDSGPSINDFHLLTLSAGLSTTHRGVWGGQQSRMVVTDEGVFAVYVYKQHGELLGTEDGYHFADRRSVALVMQPAACPNGDWVVLHTWNHNSNIPIIMSDASGNVYVAMYEGIQTWPIRDYRPSVARYTAGSWDIAAGQLTVPIQSNIWMEMGGHHGEYTSANISPDGIIYLIAADNVREGAASGQGYMDIVVFDTNSFTWTAMGRLWTEFRFCYMYLNFVRNANGGYDIEIIGNRDELWHRLGYANRPPFDWIFDGFTYWRISPEFPTTPGANSSMPPTGGAAWRPVPNYVNVLQETELIMANPADYPGSAFPHLYNAGTGDVFWDDNGDIHMIYSRRDSYTNQATQMWHMLIRDGEVVFNQMLFAGARTMFMFKDSAGSYYIMEANQNGSQARLHEAVAISDAGWTFAEVGVFELPMPIRIYGFSQAFINGMSSHGDEIHVMYPVRGPFWNQQGPADEWAYFRLCLVSDVSDDFVPVIGITGVPLRGTVGAPLNLAGAVSPATATNRAIIWSVVSGTATITGDTITATTAGPVVVMATIVDGEGVGADFTAEFTINFTVAQAGTPDPDPGPAATPRPSPTPTPPAPPSPAPLQPIVVEEDDVTVTIPVEVQEEWVDENSNLPPVVVDVTVARPEESKVLLEVNLNITVGGNAIEETNNPVIVEVSLESVDLADVNPNRIVVIEEDGTLIAGIFDSETETFVFETNVTGNFEIAYISSLIWLQLQIGLYDIYDVAENMRRLPIDLDVAPVIIDNRTMVPLRFVAYALGAEVDWYHPTRTVTVRYQDRTLSFAIGELAPGMDVPAQIVNNRTMVPLRFVMEFFDADVIWNPETRDITIIVM